MSFSSSLAILIMLSVIWVVAYPAEARKWIAKIRQKYHQLLVEKYGRISARKLKQNSITLAKQKDIPVKLAEKVFRENHAGIVQRLGSRHVDEFFND